MTPEQEYLEQEYLEQFIRVRILFLQMSKTMAELRLLQLHAEDAVLRLEKLVYQLDKIG